MDEEWNQSGVMINKDCFISSTAASENDLGIDLTSYESHLLLDESMDNDVMSTIKIEPSEETSDYNGSSSGSPSSSLSSPTDMKEEPLGLDINFCVPFSTNNFSPASSSHSPFTHHNGQQQQHSPLPPVTHFSQQVHHPQEVNGQANFVNGNFVFRADGSIYLDDCSPSPPSSDRSSPMDNGISHVVNAMVYDAIQPASFDVSGGMINNLAAAQQQLKARSKMHEMAVKQRLITDQSLQDPRSQGQVLLSAEEQRTLAQEGYPIPTRLPLTKSEEEALKIVRRKIKNKLSAQESRRKRKEYLDALEIRVQGCINENTFLKSRLRALEAHNLQLEDNNRQLQIQMRLMEDELGMTRVNVGNQPAPAEHRQ